MLIMFLEVAAVPTEMATRSSAVDFSLLFIKMIAALVVSVVLAILILRYALPKLSFASKSKADGPIKIISRISLGPKQHLYLVKAAEKCILLGVTDHSVNKITEIEGEACHCEAQRLWRGPKQSPEK